MSMDIDKILAPYETPVLVDFTLELRSGASYSHSYFVPRAIVREGGSALEDYLVLLALGDKIDVSVDKIYWKG